MGDMRESELLEHIYARSVGIRASGGWSVVVGPGDDAAVVRSPKGDTLLVTVDQVVEGRHYEPGTAIDLIARKAVARSVSDIAAMGGRPSWATATALLPKGYAHADELFDRMAHWAGHWGCPLIGGDVASHGSAGDPLTLTVTVAGVMPDGCEPVLRSGVQPGDWIGVTGSIGGSYESGRHLTFEPPVERASGLLERHGGGLHAMIDISDGLGIDAHRLAVASGVVIEIEVARVPLNAGVGDDWRQACAGGEDHELLVALRGRPGWKDRTVMRTDDWVEFIGEARSPREGEHPGAWLIDAYGKAHAASEFGWDH